MTSYPEIAIDTDDPITTTETIITNAARPKSEGQPEYRARAEAINRTDHNHSNKRTCTPRHPDLTVILPGPCAPVGKIELRAGRDIAPMASGAVAGGVR